MKRLSSSRLVTMVVDLVAIHLIPTLMVFACCFGIFAAMFGSVRGVGGHPDTLQPHRPPCPVADPDHEQGLPGVGDSIRWVRPGVSGRQPAAAVPSSVAPWDGVPGRRVGHRPAPELPGAWPCSLPSLATMLTLTPLLLPPLLPRVLLCVCVCVSCTWSS